MARSMDASLDSLDVSAGGQQRTEGLRVCSGSALCSVSPRGATRSRGGLAPLSALPWGSGRVSASSLRGSGCGCCPRSAGCPRASPPAAPRRGCEGPGGRPSAPPPLSAVPGPLVVSGRAFRALARISLPFSTARLRHGAQGEPLGWLRRTGTRPRPLRGAPRARPGATALRLPSALGVETAPRCPEGRQAHGEPLASPCPSIPSSVTRA